MIKYLFTFFLSSLSVILYAEEYPTAQTSKSFNASGAKTLKVATYEGKTAFGETTKGKIKSEETYNFDTKGKIVESVVKKSTRSYNYNAQGQLVKVEDDNGETFTYTYLKGKLSVVKRTNNNGEILRMWKRTYNGIRCVEIEYNKDGKEETKKHFTNNRLVKWEGDLVVGHYKYNQSGKLISIEGGFATTTYKYNAKGLEAKIFVDVLLGGKNTRTLSYKYDSKGNWIYCVKVNDNKQDWDEIVERTITY